MRFFQRPGTHAAIADGTPTQLKIGPFTLKQLLLLPFPKARTAVKQPLHKVALREFIKLCVLYIAFSPLVAKPFYDMMLFHPDRQMYDSMNGPVFKQLGDELAVRTTDFKIDVGDGIKLGARLFERPGANKLAIVSHGNAGNIDHRSILAAALLCCKLNVLVYDYEGYGTSTGTASVKSMVRDGLAVYDYARDKLGVSAQDIILYGESIGTGVSAQVLAKREAAAIIIQSGFYSLYDAGKDFLFYLPIYPVSWFDDLDTAAVLKRPHAPLLILHGRQDPIINIAHARKLYREAAEPKRLVELDNFGHVLPTLDRLDFLRAVRSFADTVEQKRRPK